jgi:hypothetical protein
MTDNLFREYVLTINRLFPEKGAIFASDEYPKLDISILLKSLETAANLFDETVKLKDGQDGNKNAAQNQTKMLQAIEEVGFALKTRASKAQSGLLAKTDTAKKDYQDFIERDLRILVRDAQYVYERNTLPRENYGEPSQTNLSNQNSEKIKKLRVRLDKYDTLKDKAVEIAVGAIESERFPRLKRAILGAGITIGLISFGVPQRSCNYALNHLSDGSTRAVSEPEDRKYGESGKWTGKNDFTKRGITNGGIELLKERLNPAFNYYNMKLQYVTQVALHDPNGPEGNETIFSFRHEDGRIGIANVPVKPSTENNFTPGIYDQNVSLTGAVILNPEEYARAKKFLEDPKNRNLPGVASLSLHKGNPFTNPPDSPPATISGNNPHVLMFKNLEELRPTTLTSFVKKTLPPLASAIFERPFVEVEQGGGQGR